MAKLVIEVPTGDCTMDGTGRFRGMILAVALVLGAGGMNGSAAQSDGTDLAVPGETSPPAPALGFDANHELKSSPSAIADSLHITLPEAPAPQKSSQRSEPLQVGFDRDMPEEYQKDLKWQMGWTKLGDGAVAGTASVTSPGALSMRMGVIADLPPEGEIRFFGTDRTQLFPVTTREDIVWKGDKPQTLWSPVVEGDTIGIEIVLPTKESWTLFSFTIDRISHIYAGDGGFGYTPSTLDCSNHIDVQCRVGRFPRNQENTVARILYQASGGTYVCSGTLMNDRDTSTRVPYFLTAHHCVSTASEARSVIARWFYQRASCGSSSIDRRSTDTHGGTDVLATRGAQDSTLLRFRRAVPSGLAYSGWAAARVRHPTSAHGIHHPAGDVKKYSAGRTTRDASYRLRETDIRVENAYEFDLTDGTTEPGSSGSGLFRDQYLIGVASAIDDGSCTTRNAFYGSFSHFFPAVRQWLHEGDDERDDHGNTPGTATTVSTDSTTAGNLERGGDLDYFRVNVPRAGRLTVHTTGSTDTYGTLFRGTTLITRNDDSGSGTNFSIAVDVQAGTHYIEVRGFSSSTTGAYSLAVRFVAEDDTPDDHGNTRGTATIVSIPSTTAGNLERAGDLDFFRVQVPSEGRLTVYTAGSTDTYGTLFRGTTLVARNDDSGSGANFRIAADVQPGIHYIQVRGFGSATGAYVLTVHFVPEDDPRDDHGNTPGTATIVSIPSTTAGNLERARDLDYFRVHVPRAGQLRAFTTGGTDTYGTLFRGTTRIAQDDDSGSGANFRIAANVQPGFHYIEVRGWASSTGAYSLRVELSGQTAARTLPFVTSASNRTQRSLVRIINRSNRNGRVTIHAIDDSGNRRGPAQLQFAPGRTRHFDSLQLEGGQGMVGGRGVGDGQGNWRLELSTTLDIIPLAYIQGERGFMTTMHDVVRGDSGRHHVVNFNQAPANPGAGWSFAQLRLINPNDSSANVTIAGVDDQGRAAAGGTVRLTLRPQAARMVTSTQLERGGSGLTGRLGKGTGRWQLTVTATRPIWVMSLMSSPGAGYITNLSSQRMEQ